MRLDRLAGWQARAAAAPSGRTPPRLVVALRDWPLLSVPMAEHLTGASRAAVRRNLDRLAGLGLVHEITGQGRFRVWAAALGEGAGPCRPQMPPRTPETPQDRAR